MDVEISLPSAPVTLAPGAVTRVLAQVRNPYAQPVDIRLYIARGRAAGWATVDPPALQLQPGESATVHVHLQTPPNQPPSSSLIPFSLHAEDAATGEPGGFATALLTVAIPVPVTGALTARPTGRHVYDLRLHNESAEPAPLLIKAKLDPPQAGTAKVYPAEARLSANGSAAVQIDAKPKRQLVGAPKNYAVLVSVYDALDPGRDAYLNETITGTRKPRLTSRTATILAVLLALAATAAIAFSGVRLPLPGRRKTTTTGAPAAVAQVTVHRPYAIVEVIPHQGADGGKAAAQAAAAKYTAAGMPVRLVDSLASDELSSLNGGFWVLLQDGFADLQTAQAYCDKWRATAPTCKITS